MNAINGSQKCPPDSPAMEPFSSLSPRSGRKSVETMSISCGLSGTLNCCDSALKRVTAAACRNQCIQVGICGHQSLCCLGTTFGSCSCVLWLRKLRLIIRMLCVPFLNTSFIAFPSAEPCSITLLPADQTDVSVTFFPKECLQVLHRLPARSHEQHRYNNQNLFAAK